MSHMTMASSSCIISFIYVLSVGSFMWLSQARMFYVGGGDGWTLKPSENYTHWAERNRFLVNDSIVFKYKTGNDSVFVVDANSYHKCDKDSPFKIFTDGNSTFKFDKSGPFFFLSGHEQNCEKGQKFEVVVLSEHHHKKSHIAPSISMPPQQNTDLSPQYSMEHHTSSHYVNSIASAPYNAPAPAPSAASHVIIPTIMFIGYSFIVSYYSTVIG